MTLTLEGKNRIRLTFRYDPALVEWVRSVPGREWNATGKFWTVPLMALFRVLDDMGGIVQMDYAVMDAYDRPQVDEAALWRRVEPLLKVGCTLWLREGGASLTGPGASPLLDQLLAANVSAVRAICTGGRYPVRPGDAGEVAQRTVMAESVRKKRATWAERPAWVDEVFQVSEGAGA